VTPHSGISYGSRVPSSAALIFSLNLDTMVTPSVVSYEN